MPVAKSIILVDDDRDDQEIFKSACASIDNSVEVMGFENGEQALKALSEIPSLPDVIFLDLNMPRLNGVEVLRELKDSPRLKAIPVVIYTTSFDSRVRDQCFSMGVIDVMEKPNCFDTLCARLEMILGGMSILQTSSGEFVG